MISFIISKISLNFYLLSHFFEIKNFFKNCFFEFSSGKSFSRETQLKNVETTVDDTWKLFFWVTATVAHIYIEPMCVSSTVVATWNYLNCVSNKTACVARVFVTKHGCLLACQAFYHSKLSFKKKHQSFYDFSKYFNVFQNLCRSSFSSSHRSFHYSFIKKFASLACYCMLFCELSIFPISISYPSACLSIWCYAACAFTQIIKRQFLCIWLHTKKTNSFKEKKSKKIKHLNLKDHEKKVSFLIHSINLLFPLLLSNFFTAYFPSSPKLTQFLIFFLFASLFNRCPKRCNFSDFDLIAAQ